ncbi:MAG: hypothetical protein ABIP51_16090 [Bacteroidia bacterium]
MGKILIYLNLPVTDMLDESPKFTKNEYKQLKYLVYFALFIIFFQVFQYLIIKKTTEKYKVLSSKVNDLVILTNSISFENATIHRYTLNLTFTSDSTEITKFSKGILSSEKKIQKNLTLIESSIYSFDKNSIEKIKLFVMLKQYNLEYGIYYKKYLQIIHQKEKADIFRKKQLRPVLERLQKTQTQFVIQLFEEEQDLTDKIAENSEDIGFILLLTGNLLLLLIVLFMMYILFTERKNLV